MERKEMIKAAESLAYEEIDGMACCPEARYKELKKLPQEEAIMILAHEFLQDAADYNFGKE